MVLGEKKREYLSDGPWWACYIQILSCCVVKFGHCHFRGISCHLCSIEFSHRSGLACKYWFLAEEDCEFSTTSLWTIMNRLLAQGWVSAGHHWIWLFWDILPHLTLLMKKYIYLGIFSPATQQFISGMYLVGSHFPSAQKSCHVKKKVHALSVVRFHSSRHNNKEKIFWILPGLKIK